MYILAIDPGNVYSAYCVMNDNYELITFNKVLNEKLVEFLTLGLNAGSFDIAVIERVASYGLAVGKEVFETCEWIGRFTQIILNYNRHVDYIYRKDEKMNLCGSMKAKDANIRQALIDRFAKFDFKNGKGTKKNPDFFYGVSKDCWAAVATCVTYLDIQKEKQNV